MAEYVEFNVDQGTDFGTYINLSDDDTNEGQDVSGYIVTGQLRRSIVSANVAETLRCQLSDPANGEIYISLPAANTANLKPGNYFYDIKLTIANNVSKLIEGIFIVNPSITK